MARFSYNVHNFYGGEISPKFRGRTEIEQYRNSCDLILNAIPQKAGGLVKRPGTIYISAESEFASDADWVNEETTDADKGFRLFPFKSTNGQKYAILMGVKEADATNTFPIRIFRVGASAADFDFDYPPDTLITGQTQYDLHGLFSGFQDVQQLYEAQYQQVNDVLVIVHDERPPCYIVKLSDTSFALRWARDLVGIPSGLDAPGSAATAEVGLFTSMPYRDPVIRSTVIGSASPTMTLGSATLGASTSMTCSESFFVSTHIGAFFKVTASGQTGLVLVTGYTSATVVTVTVVIAPGGTSIAAGSWQESAWSPYRGYPRSVVYHEGRLIFGGREGQIWASQIGDIAEFTTATATTVPGGTGWSSLQTAASSDAFSLSIASDYAGSVNWLVSGDTLSIGTERREYTASIVASTSASTMSFQGQTSYGSSYVQAKKVGNIVLFVDRTGRNVREFVFNFSDDNYRSEDISFKANHMVEIAAALEEFVQTDRYTTITNTSYSDPKIVEIQIQVTSDTTVVWFLDNYGGMFGAARERDIGLNAWFQIALGRTNDIEDIYSEQRIRVMTICSLETEDGNSDDIWLVAKRTINSATEFVVERMGGEHSYFQSRDPMIDDVAKRGVHLDCMSGVLAGSPGDTFTVGTLFEAEELSVVADGNYIGEYTVNGSGEVVLDASYESIIVGYKFDTIIQPVRIEAGSLFNNAQGTIQSIDEVVLRLYRTLSMKVGYVNEPKTIVRSSGGSPNNSVIDFDYSTVTFDSLNLVPADLPISLKVPLFNGDYLLKLDGTYGDNGRLVIMSDEPFPMALLSIIVKGTTYDR